MDGTLNTKLGEVTYIFRELFVKALAQVKNMYIHNQSVFLVENSFDC